MGRIKGRGQGTSKTSLKAISQVAKRIRALELRKEGKNYREIAEIMGCANASVPHQWVVKALRETQQEPADDVRELELQRLDAMWKRHWPKFIESGDPRVSQELLRIMARRAPLLGLDAPEKVVHLFGDGLKDEEILEQTRALFEAIDKQRRAAEGSEDAGGGDQSSGVADQGGEHQVGES